VAQGASLVVSLADGPRVGLYRVVDGAVVARLPLSPHQVPVQLEATEGGTRYVARGMEDVVHRIDAQTGHWQRSYHPVPPFHVRRVALRRGTLRLEHETTRIRPRRTLLSCADGPATGARPSDSAAARAWMRLGGALAYFVPEAGRRCASADLVEVADWLASEGLARPDLLGLLGGTAAAQAARARPEGFAAVVLLGEGEGVAPGLAPPLLAIQEDDRITPWLERLVTALQAKGDRALWATESTSLSATRREAWSRRLAFFLHHLG
jgi:hypothetical protein